jgi:hypothetical protein
MLTQDTTFERHYSVEQLAEQLADERRLRPSPLPP